MPIPSGSRLGPYEVLSPLGSGGMGEVYRSRDTRLGRDVALKVIPRESSHDSERIRRFQQEARAAGTLSHPNVCAVYDIGDHEGSPFVVMELLEGETLREHLQGRALPLRMAMAYAAQAAEGLAAAHAKGIVHRDLKPENLFVTKDGRVKVLDFGLAKLAEASAGGGETPTTPPGTITTPGLILGTIAYMAPEQIRGGDVDARADVFALGVVLFEMLAGQRPFEGATSPDVMSAILHRDAPSLCPLRPDAPPSLVRFLRRSLAKEPDRRVQTALDVRNELEEMLDELDRGGSAEAGARPSADPVVRRFALTAAHVRQLSERSPRLIGYPLSFLDNRKESDTLVIWLHGAGGDYRRFEPSLRGLPCRAAALTLAGFAPDDTYRPLLSFDDHSQLLRVLFAELVRECRPARTILAGFSAGADQILRILDSPGGAGIEVSGVVALGTNVSLETCYATRHFAAMDPGRPEGTLATLKAIGAEIQSLPGWLVFHSYVTQTLMKFGSNLEPLRRYSADVIAPFENGGDPLPGWYRAATGKVASVRFVFSDVEAAPAEAVLARHLEKNVLGDRFTERSWVSEPVGHSELPEPRIANRYVESVVAELTGRGSQSA